MCKNEKKGRDFGSMERGGPVPFKEERGGRGDKMMEELHRGMLQRQRTEEEQQPEQQHRGLRVVSTFQAL